MATKKKTTKKKATAKKKSVTKKKPAGYAIELLDGGVAGVRVVAVTDGATHDTVHATPLAAAEAFRDHCHARVAETRGTDLQREWKQLRQAADDLRVSLASRRHGGT